MKLSEMMDDQNRHEVEGLMIFQIQTMCTLDECDQKAPVQTADDEKPDGAVFELENSDSSRTKINSCIWNILAFLTSDSDLQRDLTLDSDHEYWVHRSIIVGHHFVMCSCNNVLSCAVGSCLATRLGFRVRKIMSL